MATDDPNLAIDFHALVLNGPIKVCQQSHCAECTKEKLLCWHSSCQVNAGLTSACHEPHEQQHASSQLLHMHQMLHANAQSSAVSVNSHAPSRLPVYWRVSCPCNVLQLAWTAEHPGIHPAVHVSCCRICCSQASHTPNSTSYQQRSAVNIIFRCTHVGQPKKAVTLDLDGATLPRTLRTFPCAC